MTTPADASPDYSAPLTVDRLLDALRQHVALEVDPPRRLNWAWFDTFDRRIAKAGWTLREQRVGSGKTLNLHAHDDAVLAQATGAAPRFAAGLPDGQLADMLVAVTGGRAMLVVTEATCLRRSARVLNGQLKTVARLVIDDVTAADDRTVHVRLEAVRGYEKQTARLTQLLQSDARLAEAAEPPPPAVLPKAREPRVVPTRDEDAAVVFRRMLLEQREAVVTNLAGAAGAIDAEFLHDVRVAVRRTRATLKLAKGVFDDATIAKYSAAFARIGDATTPTRDLDVHLADLDRRIALSPPRQAGHLAPLRALLVDEQRRAQATMARALRLPSLHVMLEEWRAELLVPTDAQPDIAPAGLIADTRINGAVRRVMRRGRAIDATSPPEALHDLRNRAKELRYALELFKPLYERTLVSTLIRELKGLQDNLGAFQDSAVQRQALLRYAEKLRGSPTEVETLLAIGVVVAELEAVESQARQDFDAAFGAFSKPINRSRFAALTTEIHS